MKTIHILPMCLIMLASCGDADGPPTDVPRPMDAVHSPGDPTRPGTWRRFATPGRSGLVAGAVAADAGGARMLIPREGGFDMWNVALDCPRGRVVPLRGMAVRDGRRAGRPSDPPPTLTPDAVEQACTTGRSVERDTLEAVVDGIRAGGMR